MAKFSQQFLANLGRPQMAESLFGLGATIGGLPGQAKDQRKKQEFNQLMQQIQGAQGSGDFTSMKILAQQLATTNPQEAAKVMQAATALEQKLGLQKSLEGMFTEGVPTSESIMTAGKAALAAGDTETALALQERATALGTTARQKETKRKAAVTELQGFMQDPRVSKEDKLQVRGVLQGLATGQTDVEAVEPQLQGFRNRFKPKAVGSRSAPKEFEVLEEQPDGSMKKVTKFALQDPVTGKLTYETVGLTPPKEFAPDSVKESAALLKIENSLTEEVRDLSSKALRADELAANFEKYDPVGGLQGSFIEFAKEVSGQQDVISALRTEASRLTTGAAVAALPKGPASDNDIALVLRGVPPANAGAEYFASYARGVAKMQKAEAQYKREQLNWLSKKRSYEGFNAHMTKKRVEEQFAIVPPQALQEMEASLNDPLARQEFLDTFEFDYVQYKQELEDANNVLRSL
jgi:hypothetical protein